jgi:peptidyl-prolyl cis-trans isomerase D
MISWIQKYFQKHFRLVFGTILIAMAVPLVVIYSQSSGLGRASARQLERPFFGYNLGNETVMNRAFADASRSSQFRGNFRADAGQIQQYALIRLAGLALADQLHLPVPTEKEVGAFIATLPAFRDEQGNFDQKRYSDFAADRAKTPQYTVADANRVLHDDARLESLSRLLRGPGYVLPADVRDFLRRADAKFSVAIASLDYATFDAGVTVTEDALKKFFEENPNRYEVGARSKLSQVVFRSEDFLAPGAPTEQQVRAYYDANPARFPVPADPAAKDQPAATLKVDAAKATENYSKVRTQVELALRLEAANRAALKAATDFTVALYESKVPANSPELAAFLAAQKRPAAALPPFSPDSPPADLAWTAGFSDAIARLNRERFFSDPLNAPQGVVVLLWNDTLPAYKPLLTEVREKVIADYKEGEKRKRFVAQGQALHARLAAAVKAGTPFEKAAAAEKLEVKSYAAFSGMETPKDAPPAALQGLANLEAGQVGDMVASGDKGYILYVAQKQLPDLTPLNPRYGEIKARLAQYVSESGESAILNSLVEGELQKTATPAGPR